MHEASLIESIWTHAVQIAEQHAEQHAYASLREIVVEVGPLSGVEPLLMQSAFVRKMERIGSPEIVLTLHSTPLVLQCDDCSRESDLAEIAFRCEHCGSNRVRVLRGDGVILKTVSLGVRELQEAPR